MPVPPARLLLLAALVLAPATTAWWLAGEAAAGWSAWLAPGHEVDTAVVAASAGAGSVVAAWLALGAAVSASALLAGAHRRPALVPAALHRCVALALGVALAAGAAPSSAAVGTPDPGWASTGPAPATAVAAAPLAAQVATPVRTDEGGGGTRPAAPDPGWRPVSAPAAAPRTVAEPIDPILLTGTRGAPGAGGEPLTVRRGDTLWDLAARHLGGDATDAEIAAEWPRWHAANRDAVGADPDLLLPGQQLVPPGRVNGG